VVVKELNVFQLFLYHDFNLHPRYIVTLVFKVAWQLQTSEKCWKKCENPSKKLEIENSQAFAELRILQKIASLLLFGDTRLKKTNETKQVVHTIAIGGGDTGPPIWEN